MSWGGLQLSARLMLQAVNCNGPATAPGMSFPPSNRSGDINESMGNFIEWFSPNAFGGTNYLQRMGTASPMSRNR